MIDYLKDIVAHTCSVGIIDLVKITGTEDETSIDAMSEDRSVIVKAKTNSPIPEFIGTFGMPNLGKLNVLLGLQEYKEDAVISLTKQDRNGVTVPSGLHFENKAGDFKNDYRFMSEEVINEKLKSLKYREPKWNVVFSPSVQNILRMKSMTQANSEETTFVAKTEGNNLKFYFGDHSSHAGNFVFSDGISGTVSKNFLWPIGVINSILSLPGDKIYKISDDGASQITVDSGLSTYDFIIPGQQK